MTAADPHSVADAVPRAGLVYRLAAAGVLAVMGLQRWQFDVSGVEHIPAKGGAVIVANHIGYFDHLTVGRTPYRQLRRPVRILAKASLFRLPVLGAIMRRAGHIPVERGAGSAAYRHAVKALHDGELLLVMPEQTISPSFELMTFKLGAARLAAAAQVPLVPAVSWGSHRFHTAGRRPWPKWRLPVAIRFGTQMRPRPDDDPHEVTHRLRDRMAVMLAELQRDYVDGAPEGAWWVPARLGGGAPTPEDGQRSVSSLANRWRDATRSKRGRRGRRVRR